MVSLLLASSRLRYGIHIAILNGVKTTIDSAGRVVLPQAVRTAAGLSPGVPLEVRHDDGCIILVPQPLPVTLVKRGRFTVAMPDSPAEPLTAQSAERVREKVRGERAGDEG